jgi:hypothetical protein
VRSVHGGSGFVEKRIRLRKLALDGNTLLHEKANVCIIGKRSLLAEDSLRFVALDLTLSKPALCQQ